MKVFDAIEAARLHQVPVVSRFVNLDATYDAFPAPDTIDHWQWDYGIRLRCRFTGPKEGRDHFYKQAKRMIAEELYGEVASDLIEIGRLLMDEGVYRGPDDPVIEKITALVEKLRP